MGSNGQYASNVTVTLNANDVSSSVNYTMYKLDDGGWTTYVDPFVVTTDGNHTLYYYSIDLAGNIEPTNEAEFKIKHDIVPPVTTHEFDGIVGNNGWYTSPVVVTLTAVDDSSGVAFTMYKVDDDVEWHNYTGSFPVIEDGEHAIVYYSVDRVGNEENPCDVELKIDATVPSIDLTATAQNLLKTEWLLVANVSDATSGVAKVEFYVASILVGNVTAAPYEFLYEGTGTPAQAIVYDAAGNSKISNEVAVTAYEINSQQQSTPFAHMFMSLKNI
ncbi:MAG: hypothetical protein IMZ43_03285 [Thermoplasmata archaeon]|nr:hypothetical protein [Thermoplasmata archaeon]